MKTTPKALQAIALVGLISGASVSADTFLASTVYGGNQFSLYGAGDGTGSSNISWVDAATEAPNVVPGGILASLTTQAEISSVYGALIGNGFFQAVNGQINEAWLGGQPLVGHSTTSHTAWQWLDGRAWSADDAANFAGGEPNGDSSGLAINRFGTFQFNDEGSNVGGYIVENHVPDSGSSLVLLGAGLAFIGSFGAKLRK